MENDPARAKLLEDNLTRTEIANPEPEVAAPSDGRTDDDMVCGLDVCELNEYDAYVNDYEGDYADEVTGVTLLRDDVAKARRYDKFEAYEEVTDET